MVVCVLPVLDNVDHLYWAFPWNIQLCSSYGRKRSLV